MNLTFRMLQHPSSEVTVRKIKNKFKRKVKGWYLMKKMEKLITNRLPFEIGKTKQNLASKEKGSHCQRFRSRQVVIHK